MAYSARITNDIDSEYEEYNIKEKLLLLKVQYRERERERELIVHITFDLHVYTVCSFCVKHSLIVINHSRINWVRFLIMM